MHVLTSYNRGVGSRCTAGVWGVGVCPETVHLFRFQNFNNDYPVFIS